MPVAARIELQTSFAAMLARFPRLELVEEPRWKPSYIIRGLERLLVSSNERPALRLTEEGGSRG